MLFFWVIFSHPVNERIITQYFSIKFTFYFHSDCFLYQVQKFHRFLYHPFQNNNILTIWAMLIYIQKEFSLDAKRKHFCGISSGKISRTSNVVIFLLEIVHFPPLVAEGNHEKIDFPKRHFCSLPVNLERIYKNSQVNKFQKGPVHSPIPLTYETGAPCWMLISPSPIFMQYVSYINEI